jgi:hypothetical protein
MNIEEQMHVSEMEKFLERHELKHFHYDVFEKIITLIIAALGLIAALAWDKALHHLFEKIFGHGGTVAQDLGYAVTITVFAAIISLRLGKLANTRHNRIHIRTKKEQGQQVQE